MKIYGFLIQISLKFIPKGSSSKKSAQIQEMGWCQMDEKAITWANLDQYFW